MKNLLGIIYLLLITTIAFGQNKNIGSPVNILLFTADDLGYEINGTFGRSTLDVTPNLDKFASEGVSFKNGYTNTPICQPSRAIMATGKYGVSTGMMGFIHMKKAFPTSMGTFQKHGYHTGVMGKIDHSTPNMKFTWDYKRDQDELGSGRSPKKYGEYSAEFFKQCGEKGKPFFLMINSHDPHRPFQDPEGPYLPGAEKPSKLYTPEQVDIPQYLPNTEQVRYELSCYYNSSRRLDDTFGAVMAALKEAGLYESTIIVFLSDNGSAFPFAKANAYNCSMHTPFYVHWPKGMKRGLVVENEMVSEVDLFPTFLEAAGIKLDSQLDGQSFLSLLKGEKQKNRDYVFGEIDYKAGGNATPMRSVNDKKFMYIYNAWSCTGDSYKNNNEGEIIKKITAEADPELLKWVEYYRHRTTEEMYDLEQDPDCVNNLIKSDEHANHLERLKGVMREWMAEHNDLVLPVFDKMYDTKFVTTYLNEDYPEKTSLMPTEQVVEYEEKMKAKAEKRKKMKN